MTFNMQQELKIVCINFGRIEFVNLPNISRDEAYEMLMASIHSGRPKTVLAVLAHIKKHFKRSKVLTKLMCKSHNSHQLQIAQFILNRDIYSKKIRLILQKKFKVLFPPPTTTSLQAMTFFYPSFNEEIESLHLSDLTSFIDLPDEHHSYSKLKLEKLDTIILAPFCCLRNARGINLIGDIQMEEDCLNSCQQ